MKGSRRDRDYCTNSCSIQKEDNSLRHNAAKNHFLFINSIEIHEKFEFLDPKYWNSRIFSLKKWLNNRFFFQVEKWGKIIFSPKFNWNSWNIWIFGPKILQLQNFHFDFWHKNSNISLILLPWIAYFWRENSKIWTVRIFNKIEFYDKNWDTTAVCKVELYFLCASMGLSISQ